MFLYFWVSDGNRMRNAETGQENVMLSEKAQKTLVQDDLEGLVLTISTSKPCWRLMLWYFSQCVYAVWSTLCWFFFSFFMLKCEEGRKVGTRLTEFPLSFEYLAQSGLTCSLGFSIHVMLQEMIFQCGCSRYPLFPNTFLHVWLHPMLHVSCFIPLFLSSWSPEVSET